MSPRTDTCECAARGVVAVEGPFLPQQAKMKFISLMLAISSSAVHGFSLRRAMTLAPRVRSLLGSQTTATEEKPAAALAGDAGAVTDALISIFGADPLNKPLVVDASAVAAACAGNVVWDDR